MDFSVTGALLDGLGTRGRHFVRAQGIRLALPSIEPYREKWLPLGIPAAEIDRAVAFHDRWGGLLLPPAPVYDGGPRYFSGDLPEYSTEAGWAFDAGPARTALPFGFLIGPAGEFGVDGDRWAPLHETVEGWVESLALAHHASASAARITRLTGDALDDLDLTGCTPVPEVAGLADTWWRGEDTLVARYTGEAEACGFPPYRTALVYSGFGDADLRGIG